MTRLRTPTYRLHKPSGQAVVTLNGHDRYLGRYGSTASRQEYDRLLAEWLASGRGDSGSKTAAGNVTIAELAAAHLEWCDTHYRKGGRPTTEPKNIALALRPLLRLYAATLARDFGPLALKAVRQTMIDSDLCRNEVNKRVRKIARAFKWAVEVEMIPPSVHQALASVSGLARGRSGARESDPVKPVPEEHVEAVRPLVSRQVWAMIELQRLTGMRPGEVCSIRTCDLDVSGPHVWTYTPREHKTEHHDRERRIYLGPKAQAVLKPWLWTVLIDYLFSPNEAEAERNDRRSQARTSRRKPSEARTAHERRKAARRVIGDRYTVDAYRHAIRNACRKLGIPTWHPHQLRHNAATRLRREFGIDTARTVLGHASAGVTEMYAERDQEAAREAMLRSG